MLTDSDYYMLQVLCLFCVDVQDRHIQKLKCNKQVLF